MTYIYYAFYLILVVSGVVLFITKNRRLHMSILLMVVGMAVATVLLRTVVARAIIDARDDAMYREGVAMMLNGIDPLFFFNVLACCLLFLVAVFKRS